jgi:hypothetical protein
MPVPLNPIAVGEFVALLAMLMFAPLTAPVEVGAKVTVSVADCPGVRTVPLGTPLVRNPAPVTVIAEIVTFAFPPFVSEVVCELLLPSFTFPNDKLPGFAPSVRVAACPVPERLITSEAGLPFVFNVTEPFTAPADDGSNVTLNVPLLPAPIVVDVLSPV